MKNIPSAHKVTLKVFTRFERRRVRAHVALVGEPHIAEGGKVELQLVSDDTGKILQRRTIRLLSAKEHANFSLSDVPWGCCRFEAVFTNRYGEKFPARVIQDKWPENAPWLAARQGIISRVPLPWTPLKTHKTAAGILVECWGRIYQFSRHHLLSGIQSAGQEILGRPVQLGARMNGKDIRWRPGTQRAIANSPSNAVISHTFSAGPLRLMVRSEIAFDGLARFDCKLSARCKVRVDTVTLEIPLSGQCVKYLYRFPGRWGSAQNATALRDDHLTMGFHPFVWLGDEDRGLAWFAESDENWFNLEPNGVTEIVREGETTVLRLHLVSSPVILVPRGKKPAVRTRDYAPVHQAQLECLHYTFGLQATPVKPVEKDAWDYRIFCISRRTPGFTGRFGLSRPMLDKLAESGVKTVVIFDHWADADSYIWTRDIKELKKLVKACHNRGLKVLLYFGFLLSDLAPEWLEFGKECIVLPKGGYPIDHYFAMPGQSAWRVCLRSIWQDFLAAGIARVMDELDTDGVYLDGTQYPFPCYNTLHGCGALRPDATMRPTYPFFAVRSTMRRIYQIVRSRKPDGQVNVHNSTCMTIPTLGWATSYWDGEQFGHIPETRGIGSLLPLEAFRTEFMGRQWGVPAEFLCYGQPMTYREAWAICLLHDVPVRPIRFEPDLHLASCIWRLMDEFGRKEAEWLPYWRNAEYVSVSPAGAYASLYRHPRNGVLVVVSNLGANRALVRLRLDLKRLGLLMPLAAQDVLAKRTVLVRQGAISCSLPRLGWKILHVRGAGEGSQR